MVPANQRVILRSSFMKLHDVMYSEGSEMALRSVTPGAQQMAQLKTVHRYFLLHALGTVWGSKGSLGKPWILVRKKQIHCRPSFLL